MAKGIKGFQPGNKVGMGTRFTTLNQPKNKGRKNRFSTMLKKQCNISLDPELLKEFSKEQIQELLKMILVMDPRETLVITKKLNQDFKEIQETFKEGKQPEAIKATGKLYQIFISLNTAIQRETAAGKADTVKWMIEYLFGRSVQPIEGELTNVQASQDLSMLTTEELNQYLELQRKIQAGKAADE